MKFYNNRSIVVLLLVDCEAKGLAVSLVLVTGWLPISANGSNISWVSLLLGGSTIFAFLEAYRSNGLVGPDCRCPGVSRKGLVVFVLEWDAVVFTTFSWIGELDSKSSKFIRLSTVACFFFLLLFLGFFFNSSSWLGVSVGTSGTITCDFFLLGFFVSINSSSVFSSSSDDAFTFICFFFFFW